VRDAALVRGSPLFRTLLLAGGLLLAGWGMLRFGGTAVAKVQAAPTTQAESGPAATTGFALKLSAPASSVELKDREGRTLFRAGSADPLVGMIALASADPAVFVSIHWQAAPPAGLNHFAKLSLEPAGKPTLVRYFETAGDLDDVWELPAE